MTIPMRIEELRDAAEGRLKPGDEFAFVTDSRTANGKVLLALAMPAGSFVVEIDKSEYGLAGAERLGNLFGFHLELTRKARAAP